MAQPSSTLFVQNLDESLRKDGALLGFEQRKRGQLTVRGRLEEGRLPAVFDPWQGHRRRRPQRGQDEGFGARRLQVRTSLPLSERELRKAVGTCKGLPKLCVGWTDRVCWAGSWCASPHLARTQADRARQRISYAKGRSHATIKQDAGEEVLYLVKMGLKDPDTLQDISDPAKGGRMLVSGAQASNVGLSSRWPLLQD